MSICSAGGATPQRPRGGQKPEPRNALWDRPRTVRFAHVFGKSVIVQGEWWGRYAER